MCCAGCILPLGFFCVGVHSACSVYGAVAFRIDAALMKFLVLLLVALGWLVRVVEAGLGAGGFRGVSVVLDHTPSPGICLSPTGG